MSAKDEWQTMYPMRDISWYLGDKIFILIKYCSNFIGELVTNTSCHVTSRVITNRCEVPDHNACYLYNSEHCITELLNRCCQVIYHSDVHLL